jgi:fibronectin-binding autotransporter adhesin
MKTPPSDPRFNSTATHLARPRGRWPSALGRLGCVSLLLLAPSLRAATISKTDDANALNLSTSWANGVTPGFADVAQFDHAITKAISPNLGADTNWLGIKVTDPGGAVVIGNSPAATLTLGSAGADLSSATANLTLQCGLILDGGQRWSVASSRTLDASAVTVGRTKGTVDFSGAGMIKLGNPLSLGIVGPWATFGGDDWAAGAAGGAVSAYAGYTSDFASGNNTVASVAGSGSPTTGTLKTTASFTWSGNGGDVLTLDNGGLLIPSGVSNFFNGSGGNFTLKGPAGGELIFQGGGTLNLTSTCVIANNTSASSLTKSGNGTLILSGANTYSGGTRLNSGTLRLGNNNAVGTGAFGISGGTLDMVGGGTYTLVNSSYTWDGDFTYAGSSGGTLQYQHGSGGVLTITRPVRVTVNGGTLVTPGTPRDNGNGFTKDGPGALEIYRASGLGGGTVHMLAGTLRLTHITSEGTASAMEECIAGEILDLQGGTLYLVTGATNHLIAGLKGPANLNIISSAAAATTLGVGCSGTTYSGSLTDTNGSGVSVHSQFETTGGSGVQGLSGTNTYSGNTVLCMNTGWNSDNASTNVLALIGNGSISNSPLIWMGLVYTNKNNFGAPVLYQPGAVFDVSGRVGGSYTLASGQKLQGLGSVNGTLVVPAGATIAPGPISPYDSTLMGTQYYSRTPTLQGTVTMRLYKSGRTLANDQVVVMPGGGKLNYGGTLTVTAIGDIPAAGDKFTLFVADSFGGSFSTVTLPALPGSLRWNTDRLTIDGSIAVETRPGNVVDHYVVSASPTQQGGAPVMLTVTAVNFSGATLNTNVGVTLSATGNAKFDGNGNGTYGESGDTSLTLTNGTGTIRTKDMTAETVTITATDANLVWGSTNITFVSGLLDHFSVAVALPAALGRPFNVRVTGQDNLGVTVVDDNTTMVALSSSLSGLGFDDGFGNYNSAYSAPLTAGVLTIPAKDNIAEAGTITATADTVTGSAAVAITSAFGGDYQSAASGNWSAPATWQTYNGTQWVAAATAPASADGVITIRSPHTVTASAPVTVDQVVVNAGGQLGVASGQTLTLNANPAILSTAYATVAQTPAPPAIDGTVDAMWSKAYSQAATNVCSIINNSYTNASQCSGAFRTLYDADYLYVLVQVADDRTDHSTDSATQLYVNDTVEIYLDANNTKTTTYQYNHFHWAFSLVHGTTLMMSEGHNNTNGVEVGWVETGVNANYVMAVKIPWSLTGQSPIEPGAVFGFDVQIDHAYHGGTRDFDLFWHGTNDTDYLNPTQFGTAILKSGAPADLDVFGVLQNAGTIAGAGSVAVAPGGHYGPAGVIGALTDGTLTFETNSGSIFNLSSSPSSGNDQVVVTGGGSVAGGGTTITINPLTTLAAANYVLFDVRGSGSVVSDFDGTPAWSGAPPANAADYSIVTSGKQVLLHKVGTSILTPVTAFTIARAGVGANLLSYSGGAGSQFVLLRGTNLTSAASTWARIATNTASPGTFTIPIGSAPAAFYRVQSE